MKGLERLFKRKRKKIGPGWLRWILFSAAALCMGTAIAVAVQWVISDTLPAVRWWAEHYPGQMVMTILIYTIPVYVLGALTGRLWLSGALVGAVGLILALVDYFKTAINGMPLALEDFGLAGNAGNVAGLAGDLTPPEDFWLAAAALLVCVVLLMITQRLTVLEGTGRFLSFGLSLALASALCSTSGTGAVADRLGVDFYTRIDAATNHVENGLTLSLWRDRFIQGKIPPEGYCESYMQQVLARVDEILGPAGEDQGIQPNIIMILSESFYDLNRLPDIQYERDPLENFHRLEQESISGNFHSHYLGYGTGYIEMSMLYGINGLDLPPGSNICFQDDALYERFDALAEQYTKSGNYRAEMLHGFDNSLYNRTVTYPMLGFDRLLFSEDIQKLGFDWEGGVYGGYYLKDSYLFHGMLDRMAEINAEGKQAFLYGITMENHQPFDAKKFDYVCQIGVECDKLGRDDMFIVKTMLEGITRADQALGELTDLLRESLEPTVVVFFGDHRPNLFMIDGETVYTKLGLCPENNTVHWTKEQMNDLYSTDYLIWANDAALLQGAEGTRRESSVTALGPQLLGLTCPQASRYWRFLEKVSEVCLTSTDQYFVDGAGQASADRETAALTPEAEELLDLRDAIVYDALYGKQYITDAMNQ